MFTSNANNSLLNYGDLYRMKKYHKVFQGWDMTNNNLVYMIYPEALTTEV